MYVISIKARFYANSCAIFSFYKGKIKYFLSRVSIKNVEKDLPASQEKKEKGKNIKGKKKTFAKMQVEMEDVMVSADCRHHTRL